MLCTGQMRQVLVTAAATFGGIPVGLSLAYSASAIPQLQGPPLLLSEVWTAFLAAAMPLGALLAAPLAGWCFQRLGRKVTMCAAALPGVVGWALLGFGKSLAPLLVGRLLTGVATSAITLVVPAYVAEVAEARVRGPMGAVFQLQLTVGILVSFVFGKYVSWSWLGVASGAFSVAWLVMTLAVCESPHWLMERQRESQARDKLIWLRGGRADSTCVDIDLEVALLREQGRRMRECRATYRDFALIGNRRPLANALLTLAMQQMCGINAVIFYTTEIFQEAGGSLTASTASIIVGATECVSTLIGVGAVHRFGRRPLLVWPVALMALCLLALGVFFQLKSDDHADGITWIPLVSIVVFLFAFSIGVGPVPFLLLGEVFSPEMKGLGSSLAILCNWACAFVVTLTFSPLKSAITTAGVFWMYAVVCLLGAALMDSFVFETRGKTLDQIQAHFQGREENDGAQSPRQR